MPLMNSLHEKTFIANQISIFLYEKRLSVQEHETFQMFKLIVPIKYQKLIFCRSPFFIIMYYGRKHNFQVATQKYGNRIPLNNPQPQRIGGINEFLILTKKKKKKTFC